MDGRGNFWLHGWEVSGVQGDTGNATVAWGCVPDKVRSELWVITLPDLTLTIRDFASKFHFALNIRQWTDSMILSKTFGTSLCSFLELSRQSIDNSGEPLHGRGSGGQDGNFHSLPPFPPPTSNHPCTVI